jgi:hypothetical protein
VPGMHVVRPKWTPGCRFLETLWNRQAFLECFVTLPENRIAWTPDIRRLFARCPLAILLDPVVGHVRDMIAGGIYRRGVISSSPYGSVRRSDRPPRNID